MESKHPRECLFTERDLSEGAPLPALPVCEHIAGSRKFIEKAFALTSELPVPFDVTCDLEDGAPVGGEECHLAEVISLIRSAPASVKRIGLRIHDIGHRLWRSEIEKALESVGDRLAYLTLPKALSLDEVQLVLDEVAHHSHRLGLSAVPPLHVLIETHGALQQVWQIAALAGIEVLDFGIMDFISSHHGAIGSHCMHSPGQFDHALLRRAKSEICAAALAHGKIPAHNVTVAVRDVNQVTADATRAFQEFGFLRMWSIHPSQIEPIVHAMSPSHLEVSLAADVIIAGIDAHWGPVSMAGRLHDRASYRYFWEILVRAERCGLTLPEKVQPFF